MKEKKRLKCGETPKASEYNEIKSSLKDNDERQSHREISWSIFICYQSLYLYGLGYALYNFYLFSQRMKKYLELTPKKSIFGDYQDQNDLEWKIFIPIVMEYAPFGILHLILAQAIRKFIPHLLKLMYIIFSSVMLLKLLGVVGTSLCILIPITMLFALSSRFRPLIWITWSSILILFNCKAFQDFLDKEMNNNGEGEYKTSVIVAWMLLRCVSFCLVTCDSDPHRTISPTTLFVDIMAYCFYFPNLITGPYVPYKDFQIGINKPYEPWNFKKLVWFILQIGRFTIWFLLANTLLYFFYAHALIFNARYIENLNSWTTAGYYIFLLLFFFLKYVVLYGLPSVLARAEGFSPPDPPKCMVFIKRYYQVWKYFDIGLHKFIVDHIYIPFMGEDENFLKKIQATVVAFTFIYVWHGAYNSVFWWCVFNFHITIVEKCIDSMLQSPSYLAWEGRYLPELFAKLFRLLISGIIITVAINSLIIFLSSTDHAYHIFRNIFVKGFPGTTLLTFFFSSLMSQGRRDLEILRSQKKLKMS